MSNSVVQAQSGLPTNTLYNGVWGLKSKRIESGLTMPPSLLARADEVIE